MPIYDSVNGVSRKVVKMYDGVNGVSRLVTKAYDGVDGVAREYFYDRTPIGTVDSLDVGSSVFLNVNSKREEFLIVHQGIPPDNDKHSYDSSCEGTWLLMKDIYELKPFNLPSGVGATTYFNRIGYYLDNEFINYFDSDIQSIIKRVKIKAQTADSDFLHEGEVKVFLLSYPEVKKDTETTLYDFSRDGSILSYFEVENRMGAYYQGSPCAWLLRTRTSSNMPLSVHKEGNGIGASNPSNELGVRPAIILPSETLIDSKFNVIV